MFSAKPQSVNSVRFLLASSSLYRYKLLKQIIPTFEQSSPNIDETRKAKEAPEDLVLRLSVEKAMVLKDKYSKHVIIASDQVAVLEKDKQIILTKPKTEKRAIEQLKNCSGQKVKFLTGLTVLTPDQRIVSHLESFNVYFRELSETQIVNYVQREKPMDCAGSFKAESLGIALFERLEGQDPNSLIGLPLIALNKILYDLGFDTLAS